MRSVQPAVGFTSAPSAAMPSPLHRGVISSRFFNGQENEPRFSRVFSMWVMFMSNKTCCPRFTCSIQVVISPCPGGASNHPIPGTAHTYCLCGWSFTASIHCCKSPVLMGSSMYHPGASPGAVCGSEPDLLRVCLRSRMYCGRFVGRRCKC